MTHYHTIYSDAEEIDDGKRVRFTVDHSDIHSKLGCWRFHDDEQDGLAAFKLRFKTPEQLLWAAVLGDDTTSSDGIRLRWEPGADDTYHYSRVATATVHIHHIAEERLLLGMPASFRDEVPSYPIDRERKIFQHRSEKLPLAPPNSPGSHTTGSTDMLSPQIGQSQVAGNQSDGRPAASDLSQHPGSRSTGRGPDEQTKVSDSHSLFFPSRALLHAPANQSPSARLGYSNSIRALIDAPRPVETHRAIDASRRPVRPTIGNVGGEHASPPQVGARVSDVQEKSSNLSRASPNSPSNVTPGDYEYRSQSPTSMKMNTAEPRIKHPDHGSVRQQKATGQAKISHVKHRGSSMKDGRNSREFPSFKEPGLQEMETNKKSSSLPSLADHHTQLASRNSHELCNRPDEPPNVQTSSQKVKTACYQIGNSKSPSVQKLQLSPPPSHDHREVREFDEDVMKQTTPRNKAAVRPPKKNPAPLEAPFPELDDGLDDTFIPSVLPLSEVIPCMDCARSDTHSMDCNIGGITPLESPNILQIRGMADLVEQFDPEQWRTHQNPRLPEPEPLEVVIEGMAHHVRKEDSYVNDPMLHSLPDHALVMAWAMRNLRNSQAQIILPNGETSSSTLDDVTMSDTEDAENVESLNR